MVTWSSDDGGEDQEWDEGSPRRDYCRFNLGIEGLRFPSIPPLKSERDERDGQRIEGVFVRRGE